MTRDEILARLKKKKDFNKEIKARSTSKVVKVEPGVKPGTIVKTAKKYLPGENGEKNYDSNAIKPPTPNPNEVPVINRWIDFFMKKTKIKEEKPEITEFDLVEQPDGTFVRKKK